MLDLAEVMKIARRKKAYEVEHDMRIESKNLRVITLVEPVPTDMLIGAEFVKVRGKHYKFYFEFDNPYGFGMDDSSDLPESLAGEMVELIARKDSHARR